MRRMNPEAEQRLKPDSYQVFLFTCRATIPFAFASHPWFILNKKGVISRWEVFWEANRNKMSWGHLHKDMWPPFQGIEMFFWSEKYFWKSRLSGIVEGPLAERMIELIESSPQAYGYNDRYSLPGPNSNTYGQWVLDHFPEAGLRLPWNSFGKHFMRTLGKSRP